MVTIESDYDEIWAAVPVDRELPDWELRARFCRSLARPGERVLDLGCGDGPMLPVLAEAGAEPAGADPSRVAIARAARRGDFDLRTVAADGRLPYADASFEGVWASEVIGQAEDAELLLSEAARVLRKGGWLGLTTPDHGRLQRLLRAGSTGSDSTTRRRYTRAELADQLVRHGFESVRTRTAGGAPGLRRLILARARRA